MPSLDLQAQQIADAYIPPDIGRPSDIRDPATVRQFLDAIRAGNYIETSAKLAGLAKNTIYEWLKRGEAGETPYDRFADAVKNAEAMSEAEDVAAVRKAGRAGPQYWAASMTYLERRYPDRWGKRADEQSGPKVVVQIGVKDSDVQISVLSPEPHNNLPGISTG